MSRLLNANYTTNGFSGELKCYYNMKRYNKGTTTAVNKLARPFDELADAAVNAQWNLARSRVTSSSDGVRNSLEAI